MKDKIKIIEAVSTWQGEGISSGQRFLLLRFKYCSRVCKYCDTLVKMRISQESEYSLENIQKILNNERINLMISGGEPTFEPHFDDTLKLLNKLDYNLANLETNGYKLYELIQKVDPDKNIEFMYSPKIFTEDELNNEINQTEKIIDDKQVYVKLVYENNELIKEYLEYLNKRITGINNENSKVWLMPEGTTRTELITNAGPVFDACEKYNFNFSSRSHIMFGFV